MERGVQYALTSSSAAVRMAPAWRYQRAFASVAAPLDDIAPMLLLKKLSSGANVTLLSPCDAGVFFAARELAGVHTVCPIKAYKDL